MESLAPSGSGAQDPQDQAKRAADLSCTLGMLSEVLTLCDQHPSLSSIATARVSDIVARYSPAQAPAPLTRAEAEIEAHAAVVRRHNASLQTAAACADIAAFLARKHSLEFDAAALRRPPELFQWLDAHWDLIRDQFFILFDQYVPR